MKFKFNESPVFYSRPWTVWFIVFLLYVIFFKVFEMSFRILFSFRGTNIECNVPSRWDLFCFWVTSLEQNWGNLSKSRLESAHLPLSPGFRVAWWSGHQSRGHTHSGEGNISLPSLLTSIIQGFSVACGFFQSSLLRSSTSKLAEPWKTCPATSGLWRQVSRTRTPYGHPTLLRSGRSRNQVVAGTCGGCELCII